MLNDYAVRITYPYDQAGPIIRAWATRVSKMVVYEHTGDKTEKVHIHLLILGSSLQKKQLRNIAADSCALNLKGQENMAFKEYDGDDIYATYMTKGKHDPKYIQGFTMDEHAMWKSKWIEPVKYVKQSNDAKLYDDVFDGEYDVQRYEQWLKDTNGEIPKFDWVRSYVRSYVFQHNQLIWNQRAINQYKMLVNSYCMRNDVAIPFDKSGTWKQW